jgi:pimeloyl-ACP methyl ester carboxylesterase
VQHRLIDAAGIRIHLVEEGTGPMVLLVHGFPESWYSWRHQIPALAAAGYRAVAIDVRGYGRSSAPLEIEAYGMLAHVADNLGVVEALGEQTAVIVGHDWGSPIAANSALLRPDVFTAVALMSVPYAPPGRRRPSQVFADMGSGEEEFYISYFQEPGRAEAEAEIDVRSWLLGFYVGASGDAPALLSSSSSPSPSPEADGDTMATVRRGGMLRDRFVLPDVLPGWLTEEDVDFYAGEFERTGFRGALNRYRNIDRDWLDLQPWRRQPITVPSLFIGGELDGPTIWGQRAIDRFSETMPGLRGSHIAIDRFSETMPGLRGSHILPGCGHWVQQERAEEVNGLLLGWLDGL